MNNVRYLAAMRPEGEGAQRMGNSMNKFKRVVLVGMMATMPFALGACRIPTGIGSCSIAFLEPGINIGFVC